MNTTVQRYMPPAPAPAQPMFYYHCYFYGGCCPRQEPPAQAQVLQPLENWDDDFEFQPDVDRKRVREGSRTTALVLTEKTC
ncbi:hypothetical protein GALMADRAFT_147128 [Galerina marginata CBS 339.88]|uniref:Uncharacterized protein n=1 Tax=Galerina marginata (strain CBS 339.88) TaxID=685588 RepID=A0A067S8X7_GALM3|nr:hypothetical protein GALMADRAFT_147128 [Galerina marginata CBS 339.88]